MPPGPYTSRLIYLFATVLQLSPPNTLGLYRLARKRDRGERLEGLKLILGVITLALIGYNALVFGSYIGLVIMLLSLVQVCSVLPESNESWPGWLCRDPQRSFWSQRRAHLVQSCPGPALGSYSAQDWWPALALSRHNQLNQCKGNHC